MPTTTISIPSEALPDLKTIAGIDSATYERLIAVIGSTPPTFTRRQLASNVLEKIGIADADLKSVLGTAFILFTIKEKNSALQDQDLVDGIVGSEVVSTSPEFSREKKETLRHRLKQLISLEIPLGVTTKAADVMTEHAKTFCRARILSDIRPIFSGDPKSASAAVIVHNLQIGFHESGGQKHKDFYVALDSNDLKALKVVIERAEKKAIALESILARSNTQYLKV